MRLAALALFAVAATGVWVMGQPSAPATSPPQAPPAARAPAVPAAIPPLRPVGTMSELMVHLIRPTSDAVFYITSRTPATEAEWVVLQA